MSFNSTEATSGGNPSQYVDYAEIPEQKPTSDSDGREYSVGSQIAGTKRSADIFADKPEMADKSEIPEKAQRLLGITSSTAKGPSAKKTDICSKEFFKGLINQFKAKIKDYQTEQKHIKQRDQIAKNPHSPALASVLNKMTDSKTELSSRDYQGLNDYFSEDNIDIGLDLLAQMYADGKVEHFENVMRCLTPDNFDKVHQQLDFERTGNASGMLNDISLGKKECQGSIDGAAESLGNRSKDFKGVKRDIDLTVDSMLPKNATPELKTAMRMRVTSEIFTKLYADPTKREIANQLIITLAKSEPEIAGELLARSAQSDNVKQSGGKLEPEDKKGIAQNVFSEIKDPSLRQRMLKGALKANVERTSQPTTIMRESGSVEVQLLQIFISENVQTEFSKSESFCELLRGIPDSSKDEMGGDYQLTMESLVSSIMDEVTTTSTDSNNKSMNLFFDLLAEIKSQATEKFPGQDSSRVALDQVFLRVVNPAITDETVVESANSNQKINRRVVAQLIQKLSTGAMYQQANNMSSFNSFLQSKDLQQYKTQISDHITANQDF